MGYLFVIFCLICYDIVYTFKKTILWLFRMFNLYSTHFQKSNPLKFSMGFFWMFILYSWLFQKSNLQAFLWICLWDFVEKYLIYMMWYRKDFQKNHLQTFPSNIFRHKSRKIKKNIYCKYVLNSPQRNILVWELNLCWGPDILSGFLWFQNWPPPTLPQNMFSLLVFFL